MAKVKAKKVKWDAYITAYVYGYSGTGPMVVRVPVAMSTVPESPEVLLIKGKSAAVRIGENPLSYRLASTAKAKEL